MVRDKLHDVIMASLNKSCPYLVVITVTEFGGDKAGNTDWNANGMQKSTIFSRNQWPVTSVMTSS